MKAEKIARVRFGSACRCENWKEKRAWKREGMQALGKTRASGCMVHACTGDGECGACSIG